MVSRNSTSSIWRRLLHAAPGFQNRFRRRRGGLRRRGQLTAFLGRVQRDGRNLVPNDPHPDAHRGARIEADRKTDAGMSFLDEIAHSIGAKDARVDQGLAADIGGPAAAKSLTPVPDPVPTGHFTG